jgi:hypothetical protein
VFIGNTYLIDNRHLAEATVCGVTISLSWQRFAGLSFALKVAPPPAWRSSPRNTAPIEHELRAWADRRGDSKEDSFELHVRDTLEAGAVMQEAVGHDRAGRPERIAELIELGMRFSEREAPARAVVASWTWARRRSLQDGEFFTPKTSRARD